MIHAELTDSEIVVVDNGSTDDTARALDRWGAQSRVQLVRVFEAKRGQAAAQNAGIRIARGDLLVFTDDDCCPDVEFFQHALRHDANDAELVIRGGRVELGDMTDIGVVTKTDRTGDRWRGSLLSLCGMHVGTILGCNMTMRRAVFDKIGYFDQRFGPGARFPGANETDLFYRAVYAGILIEFAPDMVIYHFHGRKTREACRKLMRNYNIANGALYAKNLVRHPGDTARWLYWDLLRALRELVGGKMMMPSLGVTYRGKIMYNLYGMLLYWWRSMIVAATARRQTTP
jgi:GT2 family glycosyltransferase